MIHKMALIWGNGGLNVRFYDRDPENAHRCAEPRVLAFFCVKIDLWALAAVARTQKKTEKRKKTSRVNTFGAQSHACAEMKPLGES